MIIRTNLTPNEVASITTNGHKPRKKGEPVQTVRVQSCTVAGTSRTHPTRLRVILTGNGRFSGNSGQYGAVARDMPAATWDEHGAWMAELYALDPTAVIGPYKNADHFAAATDNRYSI